MYTIVYTTYNIVYNTVYNIAYKQCIYNVVYNVVYNIVYNIVYMEGHGTFPDICRFVLRGAAQVWGAAQGPQRFLHGC